jgi:hypothetical protein
LLSDNWNKIPVQEKIAIKDYLLNFLANKALQCDKQVMRMMILLLAKICKLSWFDHPELQTMITEITHLFSVSSTKFDGNSIYIDEFGAFIDRPVCSGTDYLGNDLCLEREESYHKQESLAQLPRQCTLLNPQIGPRFQ